MITRFRALAILLSLSACERVSWSGPTIADGVSVATIRYNGRRIVQTNPVSCRVKGLTDGVAPIGDISMIEGDRHWLRRDDGSIIIFPAFPACLKKGGDPGRSADVTAAASRRYPYDDTTYVFDSATTPSSVDLYDGRAFMSAGAAGELVSVELKGGAQPMRHDLPSAFPGLTRIVPSGPLGTEGLGADLKSDRYVGVRATAIQLAPGTRCGTTARRGVVILAKDDECQFVNHCPRSVGNVVCGHELGGLRVRYDTRFAKAEIVPTERDPHFRATFFPATNPAFERAPVVELGSPTSKYHLRSWAPAICLEDKCATPEPGDSFVPVLFYYPAQRLLITAGPEHRTFSPTMFGGQVH